MEIEVKYLVSKDKALDILPKNTREIKMQATYFDTPRGDLRSRKLTLRCRKENDNYVVTLKWRGSVVNGLHIRGEENIQVDASWMDNPDVTVLQDCEVYDEIVSCLGGEYSNEWGELVPREKVKPVLEMRFTRYEADIKLSGQSEAVISYDEGMIITKHAHEAISEMEIELKGGDREALEEYAGKIEKDYGLVPCNESKYSRGLALM